MTLPEVVVQPTIVYLISALSDIAWMVAVWPTIVNLISALSDIAWIVVVQLP